MRSIYIGLIFLLSGCQWVDPWVRLQNDFVEQIPQQGVFEVVVEQDTLQLPLPAPSLSPAALKTLFSGLQQQAGAIDTLSLDAGERLQLSALRRTLDSLQAQVARYDVLRANPVDFCVEGLLQHFSGDDGVIRHPGLLVQVAEQIPAYYQEVLRRGFRPDSRRIPEALEASQGALDALDTLETHRARLSVGYRARFNKALPAARRAVKDYIAYCMSGWVE